MNAVIENVPYERALAVDTLVANYPFAQLEVGQSFFVADGEGTKRVPLPVKAAKAKFADRTFKVRAVTENEVAGRRVYRTA